MPNIVLITPGSGIQSFDADQFNSALQAVAAGAELSPEQQLIANSLTAPTQGNVFAGGSADPGEVKVAVGSDQPIIPLPQTLTSANSSGSRDFRGFLSGLTPSETGLAQGRALPGAPTTSGGIQGLIDARGLQSLFSAGSNATPNGGGRVETLADPDKIEATENLRLDVEKANLEQDRFNQLLREQVRRGIIPSAARVTNRLGQPIVDLSAIGLTKQQVDATKTPRVTPSLLSRQKSIIGAPRLSSIIGR